MDPSLVVAQEGYQGESVDVRFLNQREEVAVVDGWSDEGIHLKLEMIHNLCGYWLHREYVSCSIRSGQSITRGHWANF